MIYLVQIYLINLTLQEDYYSQENYTSWVVGSLVVLSLPAVIFIQYIREKIIVKKTEELVKQLLQVGGGVRFNGYELYQSTGKKTYNIIRFGENSDIIEDDCESFEEDKLDDAIEKCVKRSGLKLA